MCDSNITVSCLADFTSYCPANDLCSAAIRPQKRSRPKSKVRSRVAWFTRKSKGLSYPCKHGILSQPNITPLGEEHSPEDRERRRLSDPTALRYMYLEGASPEWSTESSSGDEDLSSTLKDGPWLHEEPPGCVLPEELDALRGCVTRGRALFSPTPPMNTLEMPLSKDDSGDQNVEAVLGDVTKELESLQGKGEGGMDSFERPSLSPITDESPRDSWHSRQGSFEYDHLENFKPGQCENVPDDSQHKKPNACSVSIQFGTTGYECQVVCEPEPGDADSTTAPESTTVGGVEHTPKAPIATITRSVCSEYNNLHHLHNSDKCNTTPKWQEHKSDVVSQQLPLSQSTPGRLNSPSLRFSPKHVPLACRHPPHSIHKSMQTQPIPSDDHVRQTHAQSPSPKIRTPVIEELDDSKCNSWPRNHLSPMMWCSNHKPKNVERPRPIFQSPTHQRFSPTPPLRPMKHNSILPPSPEEVNGRSGRYGGFSRYDSVELGSTLSVSSYRSGSTISSCCERPHVPYVKGVDCSVFKEKMDTLMSWFADFNDQQRNIMLTRILEHCNCAQTHFLSVHMEPILHYGCPHNCQDFLSWLPPNITSHILSYLDPVSLCRASQVSRSWYNLTSDPKLWMALCKVRKWKLSPVGEGKHIKLFTFPDGNVQWKQMFAERFRIRRNWLKGYCNVRTFEGHTQGISCIQFDDTRIVSGSWDKTIKVWNRRTNTAWAALTLAGHSGTVRCLHLHGNRLVSGSSDRTIKVWDLATDKVSWVGATCRATMVGHMHTVRCLQADSEKVISGSYDLTLKVWDLKTGRCKLTLRGHTDAVLCLQFDREKVVSGSKDTTIKVWSLTTGDCKLTLHGHQAAVTCLQFDDTRIISGALDRLIKIWNISTGECIRTMDWIRSEGHTGVVRHLQADSWKIVSAADDKTLKVWSVNTGERLLTLKSHTDGVTCLQFNDEVIVSGSYDKNVKLWDFSVC